MNDPTGITRDRYCSPNVTLETAWAIYIELEPLAELRCAFMFWKDDPRPAGLIIDKPRIRDLRPGDTIALDGWKRKVGKVEIFR